MHNFTTLVAAEAAHSKLTKLPVMIERGIVFGEANKDATADFAAYQFVLTDHSEDVTYWVDISARTGRVVFAHVTDGPHDLGVYGGSGGQLGDGEFAHRFVHLYSEVSRAIVRPTLSESERSNIAFQGGE